jgi:molecular chaperone GrpE (heat shock protein)
MSSSGGGRNETDEALKRRNQELEEKLAQAMRRIDLLEQEMGRKDASLEKYRERWEKLKAGAKARREKGAGNDGEASRS